MAKPSKSSKCPRPHCGGQLFSDGEDGEERCLLCGRSPAPVKYENLLDEQGYVRYEMRYTAGPGGTWGWTDRKHTRAPLWNAVAEDYEG